MVMSLIGTFETCRPALRTSVHRKAGGIHEPSLGERRVPYGRDHERHFPDRGRAFHFDWNALKGARDLGNAQPMRGLGLRTLDG